MSEIQTQIYWRQMKNIYWNFFICYKVSRFSTYIFALIDSFKLYINCDEIGKILDEDTTFTVIEC